MADAGAKKQNGGVETVRILQLYVISMVARCREIDESSACTVGAERRADTVTRYVVAHQNAIATGTPITY